jgi:exosome complex component RRP42
MNGQATFGPTAYRIKEYLSEGKRFDGRKPDEFREIIIEKNVSKKAEGSVKVKVGKTEVIVGVKMDVGEPYPDSLDKGNLMVTAELLPLSSERFENGPPKFPAIELGRIIDRCIRESKFIQFEKLCIKEGEKVWNVFVDIYSINDDGNLLDAAGIGAVTALKLAKIPHYDEKTGKIDYEVVPAKKLPLEKDAPLSITYYKVGDTLIVDPTREEEDLSSTRVTIGRTDEIISSIQKGESESLEIDELKELIDMSENVAKKVAQKIEKDLK